MVFDIQCLSENPNIGDYQCEFLRTFLKPAAKGRLRNTQQACCNRLVALSFLQGFVYEKIFNLFKGWKGTHIADRLLIWFGDFLNYGTVYSMIVNVFFED